MSTEIIVAAAPAAPISEPQGSGVLQLNKVEEVAMCPHTAKAISDAKALNIEELSAIVHKWQANPIQEALFATATVLSMLAVGYTVRMYRVFNPYKTKSIRKLAFDVGCFLTIFMVISVVLFFVLGAIGAVVAYHAMKAVGHIHPFFMDLAFLGAYQYADGNLIIRDAVARAVIRGWGIKPYEDRWLELKREQSAIANVE